MAFSYSDSDKMITEERLRQTFSEGGAQEIYQEVKAMGDFLGFARQFAFSQDSRVARSALWGLTKAGREELSQLKVILNKFIDQAMQTENSSVRRLSLNVVERLELKEIKRSLMELSSMCLFKSSILSINSCFAHS